VRKSGVITSPMRNPNPVHDFVSSRAVTNTSLGLVFIDTNARSGTSFMLATQRTQRSGNVAICSRVTVACRQCCPIFSPFSAYLGCTPGQTRQARPVSSSSRKPNERNVFSLAKVTQLILENKTICAAYAPLEDSSAPQPTSTRGWPSIQPNARTYSTMLQVGPPILAQSDDVRGRFRRRHKRKTPMKKNSPIDERNRNRSLGIVTLQKKNRFAISIRGSAMRSCSVLAPILQIPGKTTKARTTPQLQYEMRIVSSPSPSRGRLITEKHGKKRP